MKIILFLTLLMISLIDISAQCDNNVSTDPSNPSNNHLPDEIQQNPSAPYVPDTRYLNEFDWWTPSSYFLTDMEFNPTEPYTFMSNIQSSAMNSAYNYLKKSLGAQEMNPQNGWELLLVNLGRYPDDSTPHNFQTLKTVPYIVLYNKYRGIVRVFVRYGNNVVPNDAIDGVKINLYYDVNVNPASVSGILRAGDAEALSLDQKTKAYSLSALAQPNGQVNFWLSADFQISYDPCVCFYPTNLKLDFEYYSQTDLKLNGRSIAINQEVMVDANGNLIDKDFINGVNSSDGQNAQGGYVIYKRMEKLAEDYRLALLDYKQKKIDAQIYNDEVERKLHIIESYKKLLQVGLFLYTGSAEFSALAQIAPDLSFDGTPQTEKQKESFFKEVGEMLGNRLDRYIDENLEEKQNPEKPTMPTATFSEMSFSGQLFNELPINGPAFSTPGSFINEPTEYSPPPIDQEVYNYPVYNQPLGVFALLEKPEFFKYNDYEVSFENGSNPNDPYESWIMYKQENKQQFKLKSDLKYAFNSTLNIDHYEIFVSIGYKGTVIDDVDALTPIGGGVNPIAGTFNAYDQSVNAQSDSLLGSSLIGPYLYSGSKFTFYTPFIPIDAAKSFVFEVNTATECAFLSLDPGMQNGYNLLTGYKYYDDEFYIKFLIKVKFAGLNDDNEPLSYSILETYKMNLNSLTESQSVLYEDLRGSVADLDNYSKNLLFYDTHFDGSNIQGCNLTGNTYTCQCWNDLNIDGNITVANGYDVTMIAGNEINVLNNSQVNPEIILTIQPVLEYYPMPPANETYVSNFCQGLNQNAPAYQANLSKNYIENLVNEKVEELTLYVLQLSKEIYVLKEGQQETSTENNTSESKASSEEVIIEVEVNNIYDDK